MKRSMPVAVAVLAAVLLGTGPSPGMATTAAASKVNVVLKEWSLKASPVRIPAGKVTFVVRNAGKVKHEFVVLKTNKAPKALPMKGARASEAGAKGEIGVVKPGQTKRLTRTLAPGKYVLICNFPGHYKLGQRAGIVVKAPPAAQTTRVSVSAFEMGFKLTKTTVPRGTVIFDVKNDGKVPHDFTFGSQGGGTPMLQPGQSATLTVKFTKPGKYTFICTVEGHQEAGMIGVLTVT
jgi:uncharacterized cupredoxin-like copper-binding protein